MKSRFVLTIGTILTLLVALVSPATRQVAAQTPSYTITDLGTLGGSISISAAESINDAGQVVGGSYTSSGAWHAFLWSASSGMQDLGKPSNAYDINASGKVVGDAPTPSSPYWHAFLWSASSGMQDLGTLAGASAANGLNDAGQVVGWSRTNTGREHAFLWSANTGMQDLGTLGGTASVATSINNGGQVVGFTLNHSSGAWRAFLWSASSTVQDLGNLGGDYSIARDINDAGQVIGASSTGSQVHAFLWSASSDSMQDLGTLGGNRSEAYGINDAGQVVGWSYTGSGAQHAFLYSDGIMTDLNSLLPVGSGWTLTNARAINLAGQIVGYGLLNGQERTFLLTPQSDNIAPTITITAPADNASYTLNQAVVADYTCVDEAGGTGVASCLGTVADNSAIDTASLGTKTFTVNAADNAGNTASKSVSYSVAYKICALYDQSKAYRSNSIVPIKLQLCDATGANVSSTSTVVHATSLAKKDNSASSAVEDGGNANPDNDFRYDATLGGTGGYVYNLSTRGLTTGTWVLSFTATGDPVTHSVTFDVR